MSSVRNGQARPERPAGVPLRKHLDALRVGDLRDVHAFWRPDEPVEGVLKRELVERIEASMCHEGTIYRRVRTLTRKVLDVLLLLLRRSAYVSDLPGLFQRLPGEAPLGLEYHEAEAGIKALLRRGFLAEVTDRAMATNGRVRYAVPEELGALLTGLFREETRTVQSLFSLRGHLLAITATEREALARAFPGLAAAPDAADAGAVMGAGGAPALLARLPEPLGAIVRHVIERHGGVLTRAEWAQRTQFTEIPWQREAWRDALEAGAFGTVARVDLRDYGIALEDEVLVLFGELLEDLWRREAPEEPVCDEVLRGGGDLVADLCVFVEHVRRSPVKVSRQGEVHKAGLRRILDAFVSRETFLAGPSEVWREVQGAARHLDLVRTDREGFLEPGPAAERFLEQPLEAKVQELHRIALEQAGPHGRSLHEHELRTVVADLLREEPARWWTGRALAGSARHRYLESLDARGIRERHRDRFFSAYFSGRETPRDLFRAIEERWLVRLHLLGMLDVAIEGQGAVAWRLSPLGARVLGAVGPGIETSLRPVLVNPDFEVLVLPDGDVSDVVHTLDLWAQRVKTSAVVHFRLTRASVEAAVAAGRPVEDLLGFLEARSRGGLPQNVAFSVRSWAESITFATLERGVILRVEEEAALDRLLALDPIAKLLVRRLGDREALLREEPRDRRFLAELRAQGIHLQGP